MNSDEHAFPTLVPTVDHYLDEKIGFGMTRRQWLTGLAMQGLLANPESWNLAAEKIAEWAYTNADAILAYESKVNDT